jgi:hypothetical protein
MLTQRYIDQNLTAHKSAAEHRLRITDVEVKEEVEMESYTA